MRFRLAGFFCLLLAATTVRAADEPTKGQAASAEDDRAIRAALDAFSDALRKGDAQALAGLFTEDGEAVDGEGDSIVGRASLQEHYAARFASGPGDKFETVIDSIRILAPGVARVAGHSTVRPSDGAAAITGKYKSIQVKHDGRWLVASLRELPDSEMTPHDHLAELDWLVGDWVEESENAVVMTSYAWSDDRNYLLRKYDVRVKGKDALTGTQRMGWDPLTKQIKSWVFDSRGGYGEAHWMRAEDQWILKTTGVRPDGLATTSTQILTRVDKDTLRWKSIDRTLGSEIRDDIEEVVMVRKPPRPQ
jgi:uncharacterized protein (TIGR02246 family)